jgi:hypothetical protein
MAGVLEGLWDISTQKLSCWASCRYHFGHGITPGAEKGLSIEVTMGIAV